MLKINRVKIKDLSEFLSHISGDQNYLDVVLMTDNRAAMYVNNPYADKDDVSLLVAYYDNRCVGYLGIMPGLLKDCANDFKVYWFSTFYVAPQMRGKGIGSRLAKEAFSLGYVFIATSMSELSEKVFSNCGMRPLGILKYCIFDLRYLNILTLPLRFLRKLLNKINIYPVYFYDLVKALDDLFLPFVKCIFYKLLSPGGKNPDSVIWEVVRQISENDFVGKNVDSAVFYRGAAGINWMLNYKLPKEKTAADSKDYKYFFSEIRDAFDFTIIKIYAGINKEYVGFFVASFSVLENQVVLKILDFSFSQAMPSLVGVLFYYIRKRMVSRIEFSYELLPYFRENLFFRMLIMFDERRYLYYPAGKDVSFLRNIKLAYVDGDSAFF